MSFGLHHLTVLSVSVCALFCFYTSGCMCFLVSYIWFIVGIPASFSYFLWYFDGFVFFVFNCGFLAESSMNVSSVHPFFCTLLLSSHFSFYIFLNFEPMLWQHILKSYSLIHSKVFPFIPLTKLFFFLSQLVLVWVTPLIWNRKFGLSQTVFTKQPTTHGYSLW